ncbi:MAG: hypothetical protein ABSD98_18785, partial [Candidatus Korobacteraceae bacterium]
MYTSLQKPKLFVATNWPFWRRAKGEQRKAIAKKPPALDQRAGLGTTRQSKSRLRAGVFSAPSTPAQHLFHADLFGIIDGRRRSRDPFLTFRRTGSASFSRLAV